MPELLTVRAWAAVRIGPRALTARAVKRHFRRLKLRNMSEARYMLEIGHYLRGRMESRYAVGVQDRKIERLELQHHFHRKLTKRG